MGERENGCVSISAPRKVDLTHPGAQRPSAGLERPVSSRNEKETILVGTGVILAPSKAEEYAKGVRRLRRASAQRLPLTQT